MFQEIKDSGTYQSYIIACQDYCTSIEEDFKSNHYPEPFTPSELDKYKKPGSSINEIRKINYEEVEKLEKKNRSQMVALRSCAINRDLEKILKDSQSPEEAFKQVQKLRETMQRKVVSPQWARLIGGKVFDPATEHRVEEIEAYLVQYCNKQDQLEYYMDKKNRNNFSGKIAGLAVASNIGLGIVIGMIIGSIIFPGLGTALGAILGGGIGGFNGALSIPYNSMRLHFMLDFKADKQNPPSKGKLWSVVVGALLGGMLGAMLGELGHWIKTKCSSNTADSTTSSTTPDSNKTTSYSTINKKTKSTTPANDNSLKDKNNNKENNEKPTKEVEMARTSQNFHAKPTATTDDLPPPPPQPMEIEQPTVN